MELPERKGSREVEGRSIVFENVSFTYPQSNKPSIRNLSLEIHPNETIAVVGENGAGKSTFVKLLLGIYTHIGTGFHRRRGHPLA